MKIVQQFLTQQTYYTNPTKISVKKLVLHSVGCPQPSAAVFARLWQTARYPAHAVLQADGTVIQTLPWNYKAPHVGNANAYSVGVEMTEPGQIKYTGGCAFTCSDYPAARAQVHGTYNTAVELFAMLCEKFGLDPSTDIISHNEARLQGIGTAHFDPEHLWRGLETGYTMDGFRKAVKTKMEETDMTKDEIIKIIDERIAAAQSTVADIGGVPESMRSEVRELLDCGAINGGTTADKNPDDINMQYQDVRTAVICKRYVDTVAGRLKNDIIGG